ncbi:hypothetical protein EZX46_00440, partial [Mycobacterium tuberculosis]
TLNARDQPPAEVSDQRVSGLTGAVHGTHNTDTETQRAPISCRNGVLLRLLGPGPRSCQEFAEGCAGVCGHVVFVFR